MKDDHANAETGGNDSDADTTKAEATTPAPGKDSPVWGGWGTLIWGLLIGVTFVAVQTLFVGIYVGSITAGQGDAAARALYEQAISDGDVLSWATILSAVICTFLVWVAVVSKRGSSTKHYLGLHPVDKKSVLVWTLLFIGLLLVMDFVSSLLDRPVTPDVMREIYESADSKVLLFFATVIAASVFEELFFRGFLMEGFRRTFLGPWGSVILTAALWSLVHVQYDAYGIVTIFAIGLFFGLAKLRSGSTLFAMALHALNNAIAFFLLMLLSGTQ